MFLSYSPGRYAPGGTLRVGDMPHAVRNRTPAAGPGQAEPHRMILSPTAVLIARALRRSRMTCSR